jgi:hypothetical protein
VANAFVARLNEEIGLLPEEEMVLSGAGIRSYEELDSLVRTFPTVAQVGVRVPRLSNLAHQRVNAAYSASVAAMASAPPVATNCGALHPPSAPWAPGAAVPTGGVTPVSGARGAVALCRIDRFTCARLASTRSGRQGGVRCVRDSRRPRAGRSPPPDFQSRHPSEQFLYWAIKSDPQDPFPQFDGATLGLSRGALEIKGVCSASEWPYDPALIPGNLSHGSSNAPSLGAQASAKANVWKARWYEQCTVPGAGAANKVLQHLQHGRGVAISLPVFRDAVATNGTDNWNAPVAIEYGRVTNPPATGVVCGGHAVFIVGFVPHSDDAGGGSFIFRNSWGAQWAHSPGHSPSGNVPEVGYGEIFASYVEEYAWEIMVP